MICNVLEGYSFNIEENKVTSLFSAPIGVRGLVSEVPASNSCTCSKRNMYMEMSMLKWWNCADKEKIQKILYSVGGRGKNVYGAMVE